MGRGIATACALAGYEVILNDIEERLLRDAFDYIGQTIDKGVELGKTREEDAVKAKSFVETTVEISELERAETIIEAIPEQLELKRSLFRHLDSICHNSTVFSTNTSSLSVSVLANATDRADRFVGLHFFNPAHIMRLVEVVRGDDTDQEVIDKALTFVRRLGKTPVICKDTPAFIVNRVARPFYGEALRLLGENAASVEDIDKLLRSAGFRMGPFQLIDLVGSDVNLAVTKSVYEAFFHDPKYRPHPIQQRMVEGDRLGRKTGRGFYSYEEK